MQLENTGPARKLTPAWPGPDKDLSGPVDKDGNGAGRKDGNDIGRGHPLLLFAVRSPAFARNLYGLFTNNGLVHLSPPNVQNDFRTKAVRGLYGKLQSGSVGQKLTWPSLI